MPWLNASIFKRTPGHTAHWMGQKKKVLILHLQEFLFLILAPMIKSLITKSHRRPSPGPGPGYFIMLLKVFPDTQDAIDGIFALPSRMMALASPTMHTPDDVFFFFSFSSGFVNGKRCESQGETENRGTIPKTSFWNRHFRAPANQLAVPWRRIPLFAKNQITGIVAPVPRNYQEDSTVYFVNDARIISRLNDWPTRV